MTDQQQPGNFMLLTEADDAPLKAIGAWVQHRTCLPAARVV